MVVVVGSVVCQLLNQQRCIVPNEIYEIKWFAACVLMVSYRVAKLAMSSISGRKITRNEKSAKERAAQEAAT